MKTPAVKEILNPLWKLDAKERQNHEFLVADWENEKYLAELIAKDNATKAKGLASKGEMNQAKKLIVEAQIPTKPVGKRHIVNDSTVESLQELMAENSWGFLCFRDELYGLFKSMEKNGQEIKMKWLDKAKSQVSVYDHDWFYKQDALFNTRVESFEAKGITEYEAKCLALKLYLRDYDNLSECHCFECQHLKGLPFFECVKDKPLNQDPEALHKCIGFIPLQYGETK